MSLKLILLFDITFKLYKLKPLYIAFDFDALKYLIVLIIEYIKYKNKLKFVII